MFIGFSFMSWTILHTEINELNELFAQYFVRVVEEAAN